MTMWQVETVGSMTSKQPSKFSRQLREELKQVISRGMSATWTGSQCDDTETDEFYYDTSNKV